MQAEKMGFSSKTENNSQQQFKKISKYVLSAIVISVIILALTGKSDLIYRGMYLLLPILFALIYILSLDSTKIEKCKKNEENKLYLTRLHFILLFIWIYIITILILFTNYTRSGAYFVSQTVLGIIIFSQIVFTNKMRWDKYIILVEIMLSSLSLIWGLNLKYPLYYGSDLLVHFELVNSIINQAHISDEMNYYKYFPLYHILGAISTYFLDISTPRSLFVLGGIIYQITLLFSYLIFQKILCEKISLLSVLILSYSREFIYYGGYFVTRSFTFSLFVIFLYLIYASNNGKKKIMQILVLLALVLSHQVSMFYISFILISLLVIEYIYEPRRNTDKRFKTDTILLFGISFVSYWIYLATKFFVFLLEAFNQSQEVITTSTEKAGMLVSENILSTNINNIDSGIISLFIILGAYYGLGQRDRKRDIYILSIYGLFLLLLYVRSPLYMIPIFTKVFVVQRVALLLSPIMAFIAALGVNLLLNSHIGHKDKYNYKYFLIFTLFGLLIFTSISNSLTAQDNPILAQKNEIPTPYFSQNDLNLLHFVEKMNTDRIYSDVILTKSFPLTHKLNSIVIKNEEPVIVLNSYVIIRYKELKERCLRIKTGERSIWDEEVKYYNGNELNIKKIEEGGVIYNSDSTKIYKL